MNTLKTKNALRSLIGSPSACHSIADRVELVERGFATMNGIYCHLTDAGREYIRRTVGECRRILTRAAKRDGHDISVRDFTFEAIRDDRDETDIAIRLIVWKVGTPTKQIDFVAEVSFI